MPAGGAHAGVSVTTDLRIGSVPATDVGEERAVGPSDLLADLSRQQRQQATSFHLRLHGRGGGRPGELEDGRGDIDVRGEGFDIARLEASGQTPEGNGPDATHERSPLLCPHPRVEDLSARGASVIVHEDHQGVLSQAKGLDLRQNSADVLVNIMEHAEEVFGVLPESLAFIEGSVLGLGVIRPVRCISGHPGEERPLGGGFAFDPPSRLGEELIGAVAGGLHELTIMQNRWPVIGILRHVTTTPRITLTDATRAMNKHFAKAALVRLILGLIAEVPFAEDTGSVAGLL